MNNFTYRDIPPIYDVIPSFVIIDTITNLMNSSFCKHLPTFHVVNSQSFDSPMAVRKQELIKLTCNPNYWCQLSYQFSHEYCHLLIPNEVIHELRWFEESICALSSIIFLEQLANIWISANILNCPQYASAIRNYVSNDKQQIEKFDLTDLSNSTSNIRKQFSAPNGEYYRNMNRYISVQLMPIFVKYPQLWTAIPNLCKIPDLSDLKAAFSIWKNFSSPETHAGISEILALFTPHSSN